MAFFIFILGLFIGSFLNVLADRLPRNETILGRSHCESCKKTLSWKDLIPLFSFAYLRGKCRYCHASFSYQYPLVELVTAILFTLTYGIMNYESGIMGIFNEFMILDSLFLIRLIFYLFIMSCFIVIFFSDLKYGIIPDEILGVGIIVTLPYLFIIHNSLFIIHFASAIGAFLFFLMVYLLTKGKGMGFGDVKLAFLLGLFLGFPATLFALYIAFLTGGLIGFILILWRKKKLKTAIPFGPFLVLGSLLSLFFQSQILGIVLPYF